MMLHDLLRQVSEILTPETGSFYGYLLHTSDDNGGFLRTRHCWWEKPVKDREIADLDRVLLCFEEIFKEEDSFYVIDFEDLREGEIIAVNELSPNHKTLVKLELYYDSDQDDWVECHIENSRQNGFGYVYLVDLKEKTHTVSGKSYQEYLEDGTVLG